jgi:hypothetical protein
VNVADLRILNQDKKFQMVNSSDKILGRVLNLVFEWSTGSRHLLFTYSIAVLEILVK